MQQPKLKSNYLAALYPLDLPSWLTIMLLEILAFKVAMASARVNGSSAVVASMRFFMTITNQSGTWQLLS